MVSYQPIASWLLGLYAAWHTHKIEYYAAEEKNENTFYELI